MKDSRKQWPWWGYWPFSWILLVEIFKLLDPELFQNVQNWHYLCPRLPIHFSQRQTCRSPVMSNPYHDLEYTFSSQFLSPAAGCQHCQKSLQTSSLSSHFLPWDHLARKLPLLSADSSYFYYIYSALSPLGSNFFKCL